MFPYLSVDLVWLLRKSKEGDGFQGWHKDSLLGKRSPRLLLLRLQGTNMLGKKWREVSVWNTQASKCLK
jgi:hypothetical protein